MTMMAIATHIAMRIFILNLLQHKEAFVATIAIANKHIRSNTLYKRELRNLLHKSAAPLNKYWGNIKDFLGKNWAKFGKNWEVLRIGCQNLGFKKLRDAVPKLRIFMEIKNAREFFTLKFIFFRELSIEYTILKISKNEA